MHEVDEGHAPWGVRRFPQKGISCPQVGVKGTFEEFWNSSKIYMGKGKVVGDINVN